MKKNNLDEAQEQKMLKIEHNAYGIAFWGLLIAMIVQKLTGNDSLKNTIGEMAVFLAMCGYVMIACLKEGIWDRKLKPNGKTNLISALAAGAVVGILQFVYSYRNYGKLYGSIAAAVFVFLSTATLCYAALAITTRLYKKRVKKLEAEMDE